MAAFDPHSTLPQTVDIGGDIYILGPEKPVNGAFKSRNQFQNTFGKNIFVTEKIFMVWKFSKNFSLCYHNFFFEICKKWRIKKLGIFFKKKMPTFSVTIS